MGKAYVIVEITVTDPVVYEGYKAAIAPLAAKFGGVYLVRAGRTHATAEVHLIPPTYAGRLGPDERAHIDRYVRDGLDRKTRSLITVAMLTALGKQHELKGHLRGALNNGATPKELQEVLLHAAVYCGIPTAVEAFRTASEVVGSGDI